MSQARAHAFLDAVERDEPLRTRLGELRGPSALAALCGIAREAGFAFTEEDYRRAIVDRSAGELSDESLDELIEEMSEGQGT